MEVPVVKVAVPFRPLLKKIAEFLKFEEPEYQVMGRNGNAAYVTVKADIEGMSYVYVGGEASDVDDSAEEASQEAVRDLMKRFSVVVGDVTYARKRLTEERAFLYDLKRSELEALEAGVNELCESVKPKPAPNAPVIDVSIDYSPLLFEIFRKVGIKCSAIEIVRKTLGSFVAWLTLAPSAKNSQAHTIFSGQCSTTTEAWETLAKQTILYLIPLYNLVILDANYDASQAGYAEFRCALAKESCITIRERVMGTRQAIRAAEMLLENSCVTPTHLEAQIPSQMPPPLPPRKRYSRHSGNVSAFAERNAGSSSEFFAAPEEIDALFSRPMKHSNC